MGDHSDRRHLAEKVCHLAAVHNPILAWYHRPKLGGERPYWVTYSYRKAALSEPIEVLERVRFDVDLTPIVNFVGTP